MRSRVLTWELKVVAGRDIREAILSTILRVKKAEILPGRSRPRLKWQLIRVETTDTQATSFNPVIKLCNPHSRREISLSINYRQINVEECFQENFQANINSPWILVRLIRWIRIYCLLSLLLSRDLLQNLLTIREVLLSIWNKLLPKMCFKKIIEPTNKFQKIRVEKSLNIKVIRIRTHTKIKT